MVRSLSLPLSILLASAALAEEPPAPSHPENHDRMFPLSESAGTNPTFFHSETSGRASSANSSALRLGQRVEVVPLRHLSFRAGVDWTVGAVFTPEVQAKYQFLEQGEHGVDLAAGLRYKAIGFNPKGSEVEAFLAVGREFGDFLGTANVVAGTGGADMDVEGHLGLGYRPTSDLLVGLNSRLKVAFEPGGDRVEPGRPFELITGGVVGYSRGVFEASLLGGYYMPRFTYATGPIGMLTVGLSF